MDQSLQNSILSNITVHMKYAKYLPEEERRESWEELVERNRKMHIKKYRGMGIAKEINKAYEFVKQKKVLPSMRSLQFGGKPIEVAPSRIYNCAFMPIDDWACVWVSACSYFLEDLALDTVSKNITSKSYQRYGGLIAATDGSLLEIVLRAGRTLSRLWSKITSRAVTSWYLITATLDRKVRS